MAKWLVAAVAVVFLAVVAEMIVGPFFSLSSSSADATVRTRVVRDVLVVRDLDGVRFTNDSATDLRGCIAVIDGGFETRIVINLPPGGRAGFSRRDFAPEVPRDEFYTRLLRGIRLDCKDDAGQPIEIRPR